MTAPVAPRPASPADADVIVAGGGLVGGALAVGLARHGVRTLVVDRLGPEEGISPTFDGRASAIAASARRLLEAIGIWTHTAATAGPILDIRVTDGPSRLFVHYDHRDLDEGPLGYMVENRHMRMAIAAAMAATTDHLTFVSRASVTGFAQDADLATVTLDDGRALRAPLVVSAEGRASTLRDAAGIRLAGWDYRQTAIVATIGHERSHHHIAHERFLPPGPFAILPLADVHASSLVWTEAGGRAGAYLALSDAAFLAEIGERAGGFLGQLHLIGPRFSYPLNLQMASAYTRGRLALIGDTAHGIHPIAGQGLNLGLRDVGALIEVLVDAKRLGLDLAHPTVLERYERWRRPDNMLMAGVTDVINRLFSNAVPPIRLARDLGLGVVNRIAPLKKVLMRHAMGTVGDLPKLLRGEPLA